MEKKLYIAFVGIVMSLCGYAQTTGIFPHTPNYSKNPGFTTTDYKAFIYRRYKNNTNNSLPFRILEPKNYNPANPTLYPVFFMLHGRGEAGTDNNFQLKWGGKMHLDARNRTTNPVDAFVVFPQEPYGQWTNEPYYNTTLGGGQVTTHLEMTWELVDSLMRRYKIDNNRVYVHGLSSGGTGTWASLYWKPNLFAAAVVMSAPGDTSRVPYIANIPLWLFQGGLDNNPIPYISEVMLAALRKAGAIDASLKYTFYPNKGHVLFQEAYDEPDFIPFLLRHSKRKLRVLGNNPFCEGEPVTLGFSYNMNQYEWYKDNVVMPSKTTPYLEGIDQEGDYYVRFKRSATSAWENSDTIHVYPNPTPPKPVLTASTSNYLPSPDGNMVVYKGPKGYAFYEWSTGASADSIVVASSTSNITLRVRGNTGCWSLPSDPISVRVGPNVSGTPQIATGLLATPRSPASINVQWTDNANNELGYEIFRSYTKGGPYKFHKQLAANTTSFIDTFLTANTKYYYKIRVFNANGANLSTTFAFTQTYTDLVRPPIPTGLKILFVRDSNKVTLGWDPVIDNIAIKKYLIYNAFDEMAQSPTNSATLKLSEGYVYKFKVIAVDYGNNQSIPSEIFVYRFDASGLIANVFYGGFEQLPNFTKLKPDVEGVVANAHMVSSGFPNLINNNVNMVAGIQGYALKLTGYIKISSATTNFRLTSNDGAKLYINKQLIINTDLNVPLTSNLTKDGSFNVAITDAWYPFELQYFQNEGGSPALSLQMYGLLNNSWQWRTLDAYGKLLSISKEGVKSLPAANTVNKPSTLTAALDQYNNPTFNVTPTTDKFRVKLNWTFTTSNLKANISYFEIFRAKNPSLNNFSGIPFLKIAEVKFVDNKFTFVDSLENGGPITPGFYQYAISSRGVNGEVSASKANSSTVEIKASYLAAFSLPSTPTNLSVSPLSNSVVKLSWTNASTNASYIEIWRSSSNNGIYNLVGKSSRTATSNVNSTSFNDSTCLPNINYCYKVRAFNSKGVSSPYSAVQCTTTLNIPNIPSGLKAIAYGPNHINLTWNVMDDVAYGYSIYRSTTDTLVNSFVLLESIANPGLNTYQDKGLSPGQTYYYRIKAYNDEVSAFSKVAFDTTMASITTSSANWRLPIIANTFTHNFATSEKNNTNVPQLKSALESGKDLLSSIYLNNTVDLTRYFQFKLPAASEFPNGAMITYNIVAANDTNKMPTQGCINYYNNTLGGNDNTFGVEVQTSIDGNSWTVEPSPWKSCYNADLQKIDIPIAWANKYVKIIFPIKQSYNSYKIWLTEVGLYKFLGAGVRHNYFVLTGASFEEPNFPIGLRRFRKLITNTAMFPDLATLGKDLLIFNIAISGSNSMQLRDSMVTYLNRHPNASYVMVHQGGNNINSSYTNMRPLNYSRLKTNPNAASLIRSFEQIFTSIYESNKVPYVSRMHFRDYKDGIGYDSKPCNIKDDSPAVNAGRNQQNGSLPVNLLIDSLTRYYTPFAFNESEMRSSLNYYHVTLNNQRALSGYDGIHMKDQSRFSDTLTKYWINHVIKHAYTGSFVSPTMYDPDNQKDTIEFYFDCFRPKPANKPNLLTLTYAAVEKAKETKSGSDIWEARILVEQIGPTATRVPLVLALDSLRDFRSPINPAELSANGIDNTSIELSWLDMSAVETSYEVYRAVANGSYQLIASLPANSVYYQDNGLTASNEYQYYVRAINGSFKSGFSNIVKIRPTVTYYLKASGSLSLLSSWGRLGDGTGASPSDFAGAGQTFVISNRTGIIDLNNNLLMNGTYSKLILPEGQSLRINSGVTLNTQLEVNNTSKLYLYGNNIPAITKLDSGSTVILGNSFTLPNTLKWGNLEISNGIITLNTDTTRILGSLKIGVNSSFEGTNSVLALKGNLTTSDTLFTISGTGLFLNGSNQVLDAKSGTFTLKSFRLISGSNASLINSSKIKITGTQSTDGFVLEDNSSLNIGNGLIQLQGDVALNSADQSGYLITNGGKVDITSTSTRNSYLRLSLNTNENRLENISLNNSIKTTKLELKTPVYVANTLDLKSGTFKTNNFLTLLANNNGSSRILKIDNDLVFQDSITYQNFVGPYKKQGYYNIATPIKNRPINEWMRSFNIKRDATKGISYLRTFSEPLNKWVAAMDTNAILEPGKGYNLFIPQATFDQNVAYSGVTYFNKGYPMIGNGLGGNEASFDISISKTSVNGGWNFVANPYPCELDWDNAAGWDKSAINNTVYLWDGYNNRYATYDANTSTSVNGATSVIPSGQGFFVRKMGLGIGTLKINENAKVGAKPLDYSFFRTAAPEKLSKLFYCLYDGNSTTDQSALVFGSDFSNEYDDMDQLKYAGSVMNTYSILGGDNLVIQCLQKGIPQVIPLGVGAAKGNYTFYFTDEYLFDQLSNLYLYDLYTGKVVDLLQDPTYHFMVTTDAASVGNGRFLLNYSFKEEAVVTDLLDKNLDLSSVHVYPNPFHEQLSIHFKSNASATAHLQIADITGIVHYSGVLDLTTGDNVIDASHLMDFRQYGKGVYILKVVTETKTVSTKLIYK